LQEWGSTMELKRRPIEELQVCEKSGQVKRLKPVKVNNRIKREKGHQKNRETGGDEKKTRGEF